MYNLGLDLLILKIPPNFVLFSPAVPGKADVSQVDGNSWWLTTDFNRSVVCAWIAQTYQTQH